MEIVVSLCTSKESFIFVDLAIQKFVGFRAICLARSVFCMVKNAMRIEVRHLKDQVQDNAPSFISMVLK